MDFLNLLVFGQKNPTPLMLRRTNYQPWRVTRVVVAENLSAVHNAKKAFIKSESDEKLSQALRHQVRTSSEVKHVTVDQVYYKRGPDDYCKGPATVTGQEN